MAYTLLNAVTDTRRHLKDTSENVWTTSDIKAFVNEAILIVKDYVPEYFTSLIEVSGDSDNILIDNQYKNLLSLFASARCFEQDEQFYRATKQMNEFESRLETMANKIYETDAYSTAISNNDSEVVDDVYSDQADVDDTVPELNP